MKKSKKTIQLIIALILIVIAASWFFLISPELLKLNKSFKYEAEINSQDNFFNEETNTFDGEMRTVAKFSYEAQENTNNKSILDINNGFEVRTTEGEEIISINRVLGINKKTRQHNPNYGDKERNGFLFAPQELKKSNTFTYWHVNYDAPTEMKFVEEEVISGLKTYKYESYYTDATIDQTEQLTFLPEVGVTRGVNLEPHLQLWIEPVTGYLVKFHDETTAYYYNLETKERINPWNKFSNTIQKTSIEKNIKIAKDKKTAHILIKYITPITLAILGLSLLIAALLNIQVAAIFLIASTLITGATFINQIIERKNTNIIAVSISKWVPDGNEAYDNNIQGFKDAITTAGFIEGRDIIYKTYSANSDKETQEKITRELKNEADLIYSLTTPGTSIIKNEIDSIPVIFSIVTYPVESGLIDNITSSKNNLTGTRNWIPTSRQLTNFLEIAPNTKKIAFIHRKNESNSTIQLEEMKLAANEKNIEVIEIAAESKEEITTLLKSAAGIDAIYSACDTLVQGEAEQEIINYALQNKIPSFSCNESGPRKGDLIGTVTDFYEIGNLAGNKAALVLEGLKPTSLETSTTSKPLIIINKKTADMLGLTIPQKITTEASEVIK